MRFSSALEGNLEKYMAEELAAHRKGTTATMKEASEAIKQGWRAQIRRAGLSDRLANTVRSEVYPRRPSRGAAGWVFVRANKKDAPMGSAVAALTNMSQGAEIHPTGGGRYLAIPTGYNLRNGRRPKEGEAGSGRLIVTPEMMVKAGGTTGGRKEGGTGAAGMTFMIPLSNGAKLWCIRVTSAQAMVKGRVVTRAFRGDYGNAPLLGSGRRKRVAEMVKQGWLPMFVLLPKATIAKRLDFDSVVAPWEARLVEKLAQNIERA